MGLSEYHRKRDLRSSPEPDGGIPSSDVLGFVVHKHEASRLHYDFRLALDGVLKSWAIPKGPSLNPADKRLAVQVEDHPMDYSAFEGTIPKGNYGAGTVMVWDQGTYQGLDSHSLPVADHEAIREGLDKGELKFVLYGEKLRGAFVLAKLEGDPGDVNWLLIKKKDQYATLQDITETGLSVRTGRSMQEITASAPTAVLSKDDLTGAPSMPQPATLSPMLATLVTAPFDKVDWLYEVKWDGYRILAHVLGQTVRLQSRGDKDYTKIFAPIAKDLSGLALDCILDGEMVVVDEEGKSSFGALQNYQKSGRGHLQYYVFDMPFAAGHDLRGFPLERRKELAHKVISGLEDVKFSRHIQQRGTDLFELANKERLEGIVAKDKGSTYEDGKRSRSWLKIKTSQRQEAVIGGFTAPRGGRKGVGALVLGVYVDSRLSYIGHLGTGFSDSDLRMLYKLLQPLARKTSPFATTTRANAPVTWVEPTIVCEVSFPEWTGDGHLRQPVYVGLREDKEATLVQREAPVSVPLSAKSPKCDSVKELTYSNLDKIYWPEDGYTKGDLIDYYRDISEIILPYLRGRPESLNRHPDGIAGHSFFQKDIGSLPGWMDAVDIHSESNNKNIHWVICNDQETLLYLANLGCIELNPWLSQTTNLDQPDFCLIDLDAKTAPFADVITVAHAAHSILDDLNIPCYPKTSGKTGIHICIPLGAKYSFEQSKTLAEILVRLINQALPQLTSVERSPNTRKGQVYLDYLQNRRGQTMAAPYCVRPVPGATVSAPLKWSQVRKGMSPTRYTIKSIRRHLDAHGDLWKPVLGAGIDMKQVMTTMSAANPTPK